MPAYLKIRAFTLNKANSFALINIVSLANELAVRGVECEYPGCDAVAWMVIPSGTPGFICRTHGAAWLRGHRNAIEAAIRTSWQITMEVVQNEAYVDAAKHHISLLQPDQHILDAARETAAADPVQLLLGGLVP